MNIYACNIYSMSAKNIIFVSFRDQITNDRITICSDPRSEVDSGRAHGYLVVLL